MAGDILAGGTEGFLAGLGWLVRRGSSLFVSLMFALKKVPPVSDSKRSMLAGARKSAPAVRTTTQTKATTTITLGSKFAI